MKKFYLLGLLALFFTACETEEILPPPPELNKKIAEEDVSKPKEPQLEIIEFKALPDNLILPLTSNQEKLKTSNWNSALQSKGKKFIDKKGNTNYTFVLNGFEPETNEKSNNYFDNLIIRHSKKEGISYFIVRYHPEENWLLVSKDFQHFNGRLSFYGLKGNPLGATNLENGKPIAKSQNIKGGDGCTVYAYPGSTTICSSLYHPDGSSYGYTCETTYDYKISCGGGDGVDSYPDGSYDDPTNPDGGGTGGTGSSGSSTAGDEPDGLDEIDGGFVPDLPEEEEFAIMVEIENQLDGKELCVYNRLEWAGVNPTNGYVNLMTQLFQEFGIDNLGDADLIFTERDLGYRGGGNFRRSNGKFEIVLSKMGNSSSIEIAAVLVHEIAHAFLAKHYFLYNKSFQELYKKYINEHGLESYSHNIMEDTFINRMTQVLYDYDSTIFSNYNDYKILASAGVYEFTEEQLAEYNRVKNHASNNDQRCQNE